MTTNTSPRTALDVTLSWRSDVLALRRLEGRACAAFGAGPDAIAPIPCDGIGGERFVFARMAGGRAIACVPEGSVASVRRASGSMELSAGPSEVELGRGDALDLLIGDFRLAASAEAPEPLPRGRRRASGAVGALAMAALAHAVILGLAAQSARASSLEDTDGGRADVLRGLMASAEQRALSRELHVEDAGGALEGSPQNLKPGDGRKGGGAKAEGEEGAMGDRAGHAGAHHHFAVPERMKQDPSPAASRQDALADANAFGMIGLLGQGPAAPSAWFADAEAHGSDALAARGAMWARTPGDDAGLSGLGLAGIGEGGGGRGEGIGIGTIGALGHTDDAEGPGTGGGGSPLGLMGVGGWSHGTSGDIGIGIGHIGHLTHRYQPRTYTCCSTSCSVSGRLPPEAIQRVVRQNFGRFRFCYEKGLQQNPTLSGGVTTRFVIDRSGAVESVANGGSTMTDPEVVSCVVSAFQGLSFPQPEGGIVTVTYPIAFSPG